MQYCFHPVLMPLDFICRSEHPPLSFTKSGNAKKKHSPWRSPQFPAGWQELAFVQGYDPHGRLHDGDKLLELHLLPLRQQHHCEFMAAADPLSMLTERRSKAPLLASIWIIGTSETLSRLGASASPWQPATHSVCRWEPSPRLGYYRLAPKHDSDRCPFGFPSDEG